MILGLRTVVYHVGDLGQAKAGYSQVLEREPVQDVGGGIKVAAVADPFGNTFAVIENPHFSPAAVQ
jgi:hypothetical protein